MRAIKIIKATGGFEIGKIYQCHEGTAQMLISGGFGSDIATNKEHGAKKPLNKIDPYIEAETTKE